MGRAHLHLTCYLNVVKAHPFALLACLACTSCTGQIGETNPDTPGPREDAGTSYPDGTVVLDDGAVIFPDGYVPPPETTWVPLRRLTDEEFQETVFDAFRVESEWHDEAMRRFFVLPKPEPGDVFRNHTPELTVGVGAFENLVEAASRFAAAYATWTPALPEERFECDAHRQCTELFIRSVGQRLYRRPLLESEASSLLQAYDAAASALDEGAGFEAVVLSMVMSPQALYLYESNDPSLYPFHVAARLSYYLWRAPPDAELRAKAADGSLVEEEVFLAEVERMMSDDRFYEAMTAFFIEMLDLTRFKSFYKDATLDGTLDREGMRADFQDNIRRVYEGDGTLRDLLVGELVFTDPLLVAFLPDGPYPGLLAHPVFTWTHATYRLSSPIERGVTVLERLVRCGHLPPPPMNVAPLPSPNEDATARERLAVHREDPACSVCHDYIDPIGLTFENYDWNGAYRTTGSWWSNGIQVSDEPIDSSGGLVGTDNDGDVEDLRGLVERLADSGDVQQCFTDQALRYAVLRDLEGVDDPLRQMLRASFQANEFRVRGLIQDIALSPVIRFEPSFEEGAEGETP